MCRTRAEFKLKLRRCKAAEEQLRADARACQLAGNDSQAFWKDVRKDSCKKATNHVNNVGHANGAQEVCGMWRSHYNSLYNTLDDNGRSQQKFYKDLLTSSNNENCIITAVDGADAIKSQKKNKSAGPNGLCTWSRLYMLVLNYMYI